MNILNRYYQVKETKALAGQNANGTWYCKELPFDDANDLRTKASDVNKVLNDLNKKEKNKTEGKIKVETKTKARM